MVDELKDHVELLLTTKHILQADQVAMLQRLSQVVQSENDKTSRTNLPAHGRGGGATTVEYAGPCTPCHTAFSQLAL